MPPLVGSVRSANRLPPLTRLRDVLAASDPAFSRLRMGLRVLVSVLLSAALLAVLTLATGALPIAAYGLAIVMAFNASLAVRDKGARAQLTTRGYSFLAAMLAMAAASLLAPWPLAANAAFLAVIFGAVYLRRYGQRWFAVGMVAFMAFFMGDYFRPAPADLRWVALGAALALGSTQLVTAVLLRDDAERDFRRALVSLDQRIGAILEVLLRPGPADRPTMRAQLGRLRDLVMMAEGFIPQGEEGSLAARGAASDLAVALFDLQLVVERMVRASYIEPPPATWVQAALRRVPLPGEDVDPGNTAGHLLQRVLQVRRRLDESLGAAPSAAFAAGTTTPARKPAPAGGTPEAAGFVPASLQLPIQVTLACALALGAGLLISPMRWYWAVITAFIVFNNTKSRGDTALKALQRSGGTFAGLIGGTILATLLHGQMLASMAALPVLFFLAFYFLQVSYGLMIFFITLALALLYGLLGSFSPELLVLRLEETVAGALAGTLVAFFVFPAPASASAAAALGKYLDALGELVDVAVARAHGAPEPLHLLAHSRLLDRAYTELATAARPLGGAWSAVTRFGHVREKLLLLTGCAHWGRVLARSLPVGVALAPETLARIDTVAAEVRERIEAIRAQRETFFDRGEADAALDVARPPLPVSETSDPAFALEVVSALLARAMPE